MTMKPRILYLMQYLQETSDDLHSVTTTEIREALAAKGCPVSVPTLRSDIDSLIEAGYNIGIVTKEGFPTSYCWNDRDLSTPELQILVDAVSSSQFLTLDRSRELIRKLVALAGPSARDGITPQIIVSEHVKAPNRQILLNVQTIREAIDRNRKITFRYLTFNMEKKQVPRHAGTPQENYVVSPYATIWNDDRYYLLAFSDKRQEVNTFRVDRMASVKRIRDKRVPEPENFHIQDYTDKVFWMYDGHEEQVTLRCRKNLMDQMIDKFGDRIEVRNIRPQTFDITVTVDISNTFYAWVTQFVGEMTIVAPSHVKDTYAEYLQQALDDVLS